MLRGRPSASNCNCTRSPSRSGAGAAHAPRQTLGLQLQLHEKPQPRAVPQWEGCGFRGPGFCRSGVVQTAALAQRRCVDRGSRAAALCRPGFRGPRCCRLGFRRSGFRGLGLLQAAYGGISGILRPLGSTDPYPSSRQSIDLGA